MVIVMDEDNYKQWYRAKLPMTTKPAIYDETIPNNAMNVVQAKAEAICLAKIADYLLFTAAKHETHDFILAVVEDTWVRKFRELITFCTVVAPSELLDHLQTLFGGLHAINVLALQN